MKGSMPMDRSKSNASSESSQAKKAFSAALRVLSRRDRSETELRQKLEQFGFSDSVIETAVEKCREYNYLNDNRYATERARALMRSGRGVGRKIKLDLQRRGIDEPTVEQALETAEAEFPTDQLLRDQLLRRFPNFNYLTADSREKRRVIGFFQRRGFPLGQIFTILKEEPK